MELYGAPRARTIKEEKDLFTSALRERERERESTQLFGTTK